jgi:hypothetical protein
LLNAGIFVRVAKKLAGNFSQRIAALDSVSHKPSGAAASGVSDNEIG